MILSETSLMNVAEKLAIVKTPGGVRAALEAWLVAVTIHELAHAVVDPGLTHRGDAETMPALMDERRDGIKTTVRRESASEAEQSADRDGHDCRFFVTALLHLYNRAWIKRVWPLLILDVDLLVGSHCQIDLALLNAALGDFPEKMIDQPMDNVLIAQPQAFIEAWQIAERSSGMSRAINRPPYALWTEMGADVERDSRAPIFFKE
jgi:hypothetical protein